MEHGYETTSRTQVKLFVTQISGKQAPCLAQVFPRRLRVSPMGLFHWIFSELLVYQAHMVSPPPSHLNSTKEQWLPIHRYRPTILGVGLLTNPFILFRFYFIQFSRIFSLL